MSAAAAPRRVTAQEAASRRRALLGPGGLSVGFPRRSLDLWIVLHEAARSFGEDERLDEVEATQRIGAFLAGSAPHWSMDRVSLRRELVDHGFLDRDPDGSAYRRSRRHEARVTFEEEAEA